MFSAPLATPAAAEPMQVGVSDCCVALQRLGAVVSALHVGTRQGEICSCREFGSNIRTAQGQARTVEERDGDGHVSGHQGGDEQAVERVCRPSVPSTGAIVGSPLMPARLKAAFRKTLACSAAGEVALSIQREPAADMNARRSEDTDAVDTGGDVGLALTLRFWLATSKLATLNPAEQQQSNAISIWTLECLSIQSTGPVHSRLMPRISQTP